MSAQAFFSSLDLQRMNSSTSGWSALRMTIFAARRVLPPLLMTPAKASNPFMKLTGPLAVPPPASTSFDERVFDRVDEAGRALRRLLEAAVEPDRAVEPRLLVDQQVLQLVAERLQRFGA